MSVLVLVLVLLRCDGEQWSVLEGPPSVLHHDAEELWDGAEECGGEGPGGGQEPGEGVS